MGSQDSRWTIPVASLLIVVSVVLVLSRGHTHTQTNTDELFTPAMSNEDGKTRSDLFVVCEQEV